MIQAPPIVHWSEDGGKRSARWRSERGAAPPRNVKVVDDRLTADEACALAAQGIGLLWRGDFPNARQLLIAMAKRVDRKRKHSEDFNLERQGRAQRARTLGMLLVPLEADYTLPLKRAPDLRVAFHETYGTGHDASVLSLPELLG